jgi:deoxyribodipyrimidine photo-lyase
MKINNPTRTEGLARLASFLPNAGLSYAARRNDDLPGHPHVSVLSPYIRHRLITETEVIAAVCSHHTAAEADKFLSEVYWRSYWKGWLELRPGIWQDYQRGVASGLNRIATEHYLLKSWEAACKGETGIDAFDHWAQELAATGYLHNHARMWFASIWIFTLNLPWELGADFFLRHLLDGDPASNTLSWRWVAGLHTQGKTYLATAENIAKHTGGRFRPTGLATAAPKVVMPPHPVPRAAPRGDSVNPGERMVLLVTEEDLTPEFLLEDGLRPVGIAVLTAAKQRSSLVVAPDVLSFTDGAVMDSLLRLGAADAPRFGSETLVALADYVAATGATTLLTAYAPVGPIASLLAELRRVLEERGIRLVSTLRDHDRAVWPYATHGFFRFREAVMLTA